jgi:hypothetical protein
MFGRQRQRKKRNAPRLPSFGRAEILDIEGRPVQHCLIKEISRTGANIIPDNPGTLPEVCEIWIPHLGLSLKAYTRWRKKDRAGLQFDKPIAALRLAGTDKGWETRS